MDGPSDVREYLASRDAPCPGCGYNLRGLKEAVCPECGRGVTMAGLAGPRPVYPTPWFWRGVCADLVLSTAMALKMARGDGDGLEVVLGLATAYGLSFGFTSLFLILAMLRSDKHDVGVVAEELAWAVWIPFFIKVTCLGAMIF